MKITEMKTNYIPISTQKPVSNKSNSINFADIIADAITNVSKTEAESQKQLINFISGRTDNLHELMIASEKAKLALEMTVEIRNKIINAYKEIMRMPI